MKIFILYFNTMLCLSVFSQDSTIEKSINDPGIYKTYPEESLIGEYIHIPGFHQEDNLFLTIDKIIQNKNGEFKISKTESLKLYLYSQNFPTEYITVKTRMVNNSCNTEKNITCEWIVFS